MPSTSPADDPLSRHLDRSDELHAALVALLEGAEFDDSDRGEVCFGMCSLSHEHAFAVRLLMGSGCPTSAVAMVRLQFEAVTRAMWLLYAAPDLAVMKLSAPLSAESALAAKNLPSVTKMIEDIGRTVGVRAPAAAHQMLVHFKDVSMGALNSFVHSGIHSLRRHVEGFPVPIALRIVENSNALAVMAGMTMAILTGDAAFTKPMSRFQKDFADCLPELLAAAPP
jgi:hypothetical protein